MLEAERQGAYARRVSRGYPLPARGVWRTRALERINDY